MKTLLRISLVSGLFAFVGTCAQAAVIDWNTWTSATAGTISPYSIAVTFSAGGSTDNLVSNYPSYTPNSTFADGSIVNNAPVGSNNIIQLTGGNSNINTVTFSAPVVDPVMAIWSLGSSGNTASFNFINGTPILVSGGPSVEYGGSSITISGNNVFGAEGNGTVEFVGTFSGLTWTNPVYEGWYGFNLGIAGVAGSGGGTVPEPSALALLGVGLAGLAFMRRKKI